MFIVTLEWLQAHSNRFGWTNDQIVCLGQGIRKGWMKRVLGRGVSLEIKERFEQRLSSKQVKRLRSNAMNPSHESVQIELLPDLNDDLDAEYRAIIGAPIRPNVVPKIPVKYQKCRYLGKGIFEFSDFDGNFKAAA